MELTLMIAINISVLAHCIHSIAHISEYWNKNTDVIESLLKYIAFIQNK